MKAYKTLRTTGSLRDGDRKKAATHRQELSRLSNAVSHGTRKPGFNFSAKIPVPAARFSRADPDQDIAHYKRLREFRRFYGRKMPVLACSNCAFSTSCPQYKSGFECAFLPFLNSHRIGSAEDLLYYLKEMATVAVRRAHLTTMMETLSGAAPSLETTEALSLAYNQLKQLHEVMSESAGEITVEGDETVFARLFGGLDGLVEATAKARGVVVALPPPSEEDTVQLVNEDAVPQAVPAGKYAPPVASVSEVVSSVLKELE